KTRNMSVLPLTNIDDTLTFGLMRLTEKIDTYFSCGSGWEFYQVEKVFIEVIQFILPTGAGYIFLSADLSAKKGVVNPQNKDNKCFNGQSYQLFIQYKKICKEFQNIKNTMILLT